MRRVCAGRYEDDYLGHRIEVRRITRADDPRITEAFWQVIVDGDCDDASCTKRDAELSAKETVDRKEARKQ